HAPAEMTQQTSEAAANVVQRMPTNRRTPGSYRGAAVRAGNPHPRAGRESPSLSTGGRRGAHTKGRTERRGVVRSGDGAAGRAVDHVGREGTAARGRGGGARRLAVELSTLWADRRRALDGGN